MSLRFYCKFEHRKEDIFLFLISSALIFLLTFYFMYSIQIVVEPYFHYQKKSRNKVNYCYVFSIRLTLKLQVSFFQTASISCNSYPLNIHTSPIYLSINQTSNFDIANLFPRFVSSILPQLVNWQVFRSRLVQPAIVFLVMRQSLFVCKVRSDFRDVYVSRKIIFERY